MRIRNGRIIPQLTQNVIKRLGGDLAWRHAILFALEIVKTIRKCGIWCRRNPPKNISNKGFGALRKST
jgi:hypothetical protein